MEEKDLTIAERVYEVLKEAKQPMDYIEIAIAISKKYQDFYNKKQNNISQIQNEVNRKAFRYEKFGISYNTDKPRRKFYLTEWYTDIEDTEESELSKDDGIEYQKEKELYPVLINYLNKNWNIYAMRIDESISKKKPIKNGGGNSWLHPDIVGVADSLPESENHELNEILNKITKNRFQLYSFEVKRSITNRNNARQAFFQTLANSSWANYAYLVCPTITDGRVLDELEMLCASFGVGLLTLNNDDIEKSETIAMSSYKEIDSFLTQRLAEENNQFQEYLGLVNHAYHNKEIDADKWKEKN